MDERTKQSTIAEKLLFAAANDGIAGALRCMYAHNGLPVTLVDNAFTLIAEAGTEHLPQPPERPADEDRESRQAWYETMKETDEPVIDENSGNPFRAMCTDIHVHSERLAKLTFFELRPFTEEDPHELTLLAAVISSLLRNEAGGEQLPGDVRSGYLLALLTDRVSGSTLTEMLQLQRLSSDEKWKLAAVVIGKDEIPDKNQTYHLTRNIPFSTYTIFGGTLTVLYPEKYESGFFQSLHALNATMGTSRPFEKISSVSFYWPQAKYALTHALSSNLEHSDYQNLFLNEAAALLLKQKGGRERIRPELQMLASHDAQHETALYDTLRTYIRLDRSISETAKALFIHYNTVKYRLRMISDLTGLEQLDAQLSAELLLSFAMRDQ